VKDVQLSTTLRNRVGEQPKRCWVAARTALLTCADALPEGTVYVEGYCRMAEQTVIFEHAWLEIPDGRIVDPVIPDAEMDAGLYFSGVRYTAAECRMFLAKYHHTEAQHGPIIWTVGGFGGFRVSAYRRSYLRAELSRGTPLGVLARHRNMSESDLQRFVTEDE
jgi:hypothetical protein